MPRPVSAFKATRGVGAPRLGRELLRRSDSLSVRQQGGLVIGETAQGQEFDHLKSRCEYIDKSGVLETGQVEGKMSPAHFELEKII